jgi:UDP:flavonoid glycosyltransferase YjiC (YdhE family)
MAASAKIAVFPEPGAIGPVMNLVGICQALRDLGHECVCSTNSCSPAWSR